jgi:4-diphosphocytidyl-2-C-methyl-D-erythritol kinase
MICFPNCKINLGLFITEKRADGFHTLESIFLPGPLSDVLEIIPRADELCHVYNYESSFDIPLEQHSCYRAWKILKDEYSIGGVDIHLLKCIPSGAGLGGGSSDSSFTLKILNDIFKLNLSDDQLIQYAAQLGSDNAFFIYNRPCFLKGRGHEITPMDWEFPYRIEISSPSVQISTASAYQGIVPRPSDIDLQQLPTLPISQWKEVLRNDFEANAVQRNPVILEHIQRMYEKGAFYAAMSGSGSSVFGLFPNE